MHGEGWQCPPSGGHVKVFWETGCYLHDLQLVRTPGGNCDALFIQSRTLKENNLIKNNDYHYNEKIN